MTKNIFRIIAVISVFGLMAVHSCKKSDSSTSSTSTQKFIGTWTVTRLAFDNNNNGKIEANEWTSLASQQTTSDVIAYKTNGTGSEIGNGLWGSFLGGSTTVDSLYFTWHLINDTDIVLYEGSDTLHHIIDSVSSNYLLIKTVTNSSVWVEMKK